MMSTEYLELLNDVELRKVLNENGFLKVPITETTRNILIKKLRSHLEKNKPNKKMLSQSKATSNPNETDSSFIRTHPTVSESPNYKNVLPQLVTSRKSYNYVPDASYRSPSESSIKLSSSFTKPRTTTPFAKMYTPPPILASDSDENSDSSSYLSNVRRSYLSNNIHEYANFGTNGNLVSANSHNGVVNRLLSFRDTTLRKKHPSCLVTYATEESENNANKHRNMKSKSFIGRVSSYFNLHFGFKQAYIPHVLICTFLIFFIGIACMYILMKPDARHVINENKTHYVKCKENDHTSLVSRMTQDCIESDRLVEAIELNQKLIRLLQERAEQHYCVNRDQSPTVSAMEFLQKSHNGDNSDWVKLRKTLEDAEYLIKHNPQWQISIIDSQGSPIVLKEKNGNLYNQDYFFVFLKPYLPLMCKLNNRLQTFFIITGTGSCIGGIALLSYAIIRCIRTKQNERTAAIETFTTEIMNEIMYRAHQSDISKDREVNLYHLRDKLIPLQKRKKSLWAWNEAVRILKLHDSRVQFGVSMHNGEVVQTIKWAGDVSVNNSTRIQGGCSKKHWQSPAFDNTNKIINPPTPCLKIRHMFETSDINHSNLHQIIEEAILEKVGANCNICDIQLVKQTCCVYVRCASNEDAGIVHNKINGWWFDKRLVSIKFLRLQSYLSRFPKSTVQSNYTAKRLFSSSINKDHTLNNINDD